MNCLIVFKSVTHAQSATQILRRSGISGSIIKPPVALGKGSCSHAVRIKESHLTRARRALNSLNMHVVGVFVEQPGGQYREVVL